jgi:hypothetical protein
MSRFEPGRLKHDAPPPLCSGNRMTAGPGSTSGSKLANCWPASYCCDGSAGVTYVQDLLPWATGWATALFANLLTTDSLISGILVGATATDLDPRRVRPWPGKRPHPDYRSQGR